MQSIDNEELFFLTELKCLFFIARDLGVSHWVHLAQGLVEPLLEFVAGREDLREQEVQKGPQLTQVVLEGRTRQEDSVG
jgi:hypothetical protein